MDWLQELLKRLRELFPRQEQKRSNHELDFNDLAGEIAKAEKLAKRKGAQPGLKALAQAFRASMRGMLGLGYEFTFEELQHELERKRMRHELKQALASAAQKLADAEYSDAEPSKQQVLELAQEIKRATVV